MQCLQADKLDLHRSEPCREPLKLVILLAKLDSQLICFHIKSSGLQLGLNELLLNRPVVQIQLVKLLG